eukprot:11055825-Prorocentrum_lima.AAC.1
MPGTLSIARILAFQDELCVYANQRAESFFLRGGGGTAVAWPAPRFADVGKDVMVSAGSR